MSVFTSVRLPLYASRSRVRALKIIRISNHTLSFDLWTGCSPRTFGSELFTKYRPAIGDYYVVHGNGEEEFMPKEKFEAHWELILEASEEHVVRK
jgi:hypothetical protein